MPNSASSSHTVSPAPMPPAIFLFGPTASGKTDLALALAAQLPVEVISVDSAQVYRGMDIGTAKPGREFLAQLPHALIDICDPDQAYSAADFRRDALAEMAAISGRGNIPLLVGGSMLYFKALRDGLADMPTADAEIRERILREAHELGWPALHQQLQRIDPVTAAKLHPNHSQRIQRALEVYYASGETLSSLQAMQVDQPLPYRLLQIALWVDDRQALHQRIAQRFDAMLLAGLVDELRTLRENYRLHRDLPSMRSVGYRQAWAFLESELDAAQLREAGIAATRQLAKRQLTWLRKWPDLLRLAVNFEETGTKAELVRQKVSKIEQWLSILQ
ncbi:MAG: tRNA (adenosine(37)-N6)-dimethylallyltransferase MiaA [Gammaproteobacteria bacterium]|nr:tRNA (adenosine(37)-N6)-dimethylallyltransferase MiaA [Gammaproteobacteria bacterium]NND38490.1 tRNA (adenosine(37)-N6)-dimethylallyltransferase MiaA [Pseudomonadales bacterium]NNM11984.1 tRNA (adenosine(37)-N6)-dimethylallyltransferase MiaA [Pseudomonadales bacterium]RZV57605.1 MAG: tRNA (adenosine(37)-N6)-dimethylallyltransferase MiaA [Pseudomonadales bacterium]